MFEPKLPANNAESTKTYPQKVICTVYNREAKIVVAHWPHSEEGWSDWRVIDCSLFPAGALHCGMDCLSQAQIEQEQRAESDKR